MSQCVLVTCLACGGTGIGEMSEAGYRAACDPCHGGGHIAVDRTKDGGVPDGYVEWRGWELGPVPINPLRLTYEA